LVVPNEFSFEDLGRRKDLQFAAQLQGFAPNQTKIEDVQTSPMTPNARPFDRL
jgi:hypothetical protein